MKRFLLCVLALCLALPLGSLAGSTAAPELSDVFPSDDVLYPGDVLTVSYVASEAGTLSIRIYHDLVAPQGIDFASQSVAAGPGTVTWDGSVPGGQSTTGVWHVGLTLTNAAGAVSGEHLAWIELLNPADATLAQAGQIPEEAPAETAVPTPEPTARPYTPITRYPDASKDTYWQMDIYNFDIEDPATQAKLWEYMMQPITVLDTLPTEHIYPLVSPGANAKDSSNITGQLHGTTQGVNVIREEGEWTLIEAYSNDGYRAPSKAIYDYAALLIEGWVPTKKLKVVETNPTIGLVIDKLHQKMYIFQNGQMTGELLVSTGKPTKDSPNIETPAGEYVTDSWVGMFDSYGMYSDLAIRVNGGVLIHEVPHQILADGSRRYTKFEQYLGQKASHGCIRTQRKKNEQGQNMQWLWDNLKRRAKVLIIDDVGRYLPPPDMSLPMYYNPNGGKNYHSDQYCGYVKDRFLPLTAITYGDLYKEPYDKLTPCSYCAPILKLEEVPEDVIGVGEDGQEATETTQEVDQSTWESGDYQVDEE